MVESRACRPTVAPGTPTLRQPGAKRALAGDEGRPAGGAALLGVVVGEDHALLGDPVDVRRAVAHQAHRVGADVRLADVVAEDDQDVRLLAARGWRAKFCCGLGLLDRRTRPSVDESSERRAGQKHPATAATFVHSLPRPAVTDLDRLEFYSGPSVSSSDCPSFSQAHTSSNLSNGHLSPVAVQSVAVADVVQPLEHDGAAALQELRCPQERGRGRTIRP